MEFDAGHGQGVENIDRGQEIGDRLAGQPGHDVGGDADPVRGGFADGPGETGGVVTAVDAGERRVVGRLQAQLQPDGRAGKGGQKREFFRLQAVGPRAEAQPGQVGQGGQLPEQGGQAGGRAVGVGKGLEVGDQGLAAPSGRRRERLPLRPEAEPFMVQTRS